MQITPIADSFSLCAFQIEGVQRLDRVTVFLHDIEPGKGRLVVECFGRASKDLIGIPWRVAFALQTDGWWLRQDVIWSKPNPMPESVRDRCTKAHEYLFLLSKSERYYFDADAIAEGAVKAGKILHGARTGEKDRANVSGVNDRRTRIGLSARTDPQPDTRNKRSVWTVATEPFKEAHFATFPPALIEPCIAAGCPPGGVVLDPFGGAGTTGLVADRLGRDAVLIELSADYVGLAERRVDADKWNASKRTPGLFA